MRNHRINIRRARPCRGLVLAGIPPLFALLFAACDIDSTDSTTAVATDSSGSPTLYNYSGLYLPVNGNEFLVYPANRQSGTKLTWLRLLQSGRVLEGFDNAGRTWSGSISVITEGNASFSLQGSTTAGAPVDTAGSLRYADQSSTLDATWIEPGFSGSLLARATVAPANPAQDGQNDNGPDDNGDNGSNTLEISPQIYLFTSVGGTSGTFTASGGTAPYIWSVSNPSLGTVSPTNESTVTYTTTQVVGTNTITVRDGAGTTATAVAYYQ